MPRPVQCSQDITRRSFLHTSLGVTAATLWGTSRLAEAAERTAPEPPRPCPPSSWEKHGVILQPTEPWEDGNIQNFTTAAEPLGGGRWRIWYSVSGSPAEYGLAYAEGVPGEPMKKVRAICSPGEPADTPFSIGNLPEKWKPVQGVHLLLKNGRHRLCFWAHGPQVARYLVAESEDGRRYRVLDPARPLLYHPNDRAARGVALPDGHQERGEPAAAPPGQEQAATPLVLSNDATNIYQRPDGTFELYSVGLVRVPKTDPAYVAHDNAPGLLRVIDRYTSEDGLSIASRKRVITSDKDDLVDQQFYYLSVTDTPKGRVGLLGHYRVEAQTMDLEWCFSEDGVKWQRPLRRAWIARGEPPAPDCFGIYAPNRLVLEGGRWHLFYTGTNSTHNGKQTYGKPRQVILHASAPSLWAE